MNTASQPLEQPSLTAEDFLSFDIGALLASAARQDCGSYYPLFLGRAAEGREASDVTGERVFTFLGDACSLVLTPESRNQPFRPLFSSTTASSPALHDLPIDALNAVVAVVPAITDPELRARMADIAWIRLSDHKMAQIAISAYIESSDQLSAESYWFLSIKRLRRAMNLAASLGSGGGEALSKVTARLETLISGSTGVNERRFVPAHAMKVLLDSGQGDGPLQSKVCEQYATELELAGNWFGAETYWNLKARWDGVVGDSEGRQKSLKRSAETHARQAQVRLTANPPDYLGAAHFLRGAFEAMRQMGESERAEQLHALLIDTQAKSLSQMSTLSHEVDVSDTVKRSKSAVSGKNFLDAVLTLVTMIHPPQVDQLAETAAQMSNESPARAIFPAVYLDVRGRVIGRRPSLHVAGEKDLEEAKRSEMFSDAVHYQTYFAIAAIEPARKQILADHHVTLEDVLSLVVNNPFVPQGRELLAAKGLYHGFLGEFDLSCHLLVPQLENSIRYVLNQQGVITSGMSQEGVQEDFSLSTLFTRLQPELERVFGADLAFDLQGLLVERSGSNIRNRLAHGLMDFGNFFGYTMSYLWWVSLFLCCQPIIGYLRSVENDVPGDDTQGPSAADSPVTRSNT